MDASPGLSHCVSLLCLTAPYRKPERRHCTTLYGQLTRPHCIQWTSQYRTGKYADININVTFSFVLCHKIRFRCHQQGASLWVKNSCENINGSQLSSVVSSTLVIKHNIEHHLSFFLLRPGLFFLSLCLMERWRSREQLAAARLLSTHIPTRQKRNGSSSCSLA